VDAPAMGDIATLFGEAASRVVVSVAPEREHQFMAQAAAAGVPATVIGRVGGNHIRLSIDGRIAVDEALKVAEQIWSTAIDTYFESKKAIA
jgi:phosphoribosylformylglycinamidine (FGAM) synthase-like enzyme